MTIDFVKKGKIEYNNGNYEKAKVCYEKAVTLGDIHALYLLACMYQSGIGVERDIEKSRELFKKAADSGDEKAKNAIELIACPLGKMKQYFEKAKLVRQAGDYNRALEMFKEVCNVNPEYYEFVRESMYLIGIMYRDGEGVHKDEYEAKKWLQKAVDYRYWPAIEELKLHLKQPEIVVDDGLVKTSIYISNKWRICGDRAKKLESIARLYKSDIMFYARGTTINPKKENSIKSLGLTRGVKLYIIAIGTDAEEAVCSLANEVYNRCGEDEMYKKCVTIEDYAKFIFGL